jgi:hypothetical protein
MMGGSDGKRHRQEWKESSLWAKPTGATLHQSGGAEAARTVCPLLALPAFPPHPPVLQCQQTPGAPLQSSILHFSLLLGSSTA